MMLNELLTLCWKKVGGEINVPYGGVCFNEWEKWELGWSLM